MSWKSEVIADASGQWAGNALRFATYAEANAYVLDLARRWTLVTHVQVLESPDPVNVFQSPALGLVRTGEPA